MKKSVKLMSVVAITLVLLCTLATSVFATSLLNPTDIPAVDPGVKDNVKTISGKIFGGIQIVGSAVAVIMLAVLGVKYMMGSAEEKSEYKKSMLPLLIGAVLIFAASNLAGIIYNFATGLTKA